MQPTKRSRFGKASYLIVYVLLLSQTCIIFIFNRFLKLNRLSTIMKPKLDLGSTYDTSIFSSPCRLKVGQIAVRTGVVSTVALHYGLARN